MDNFVKAAAAVLVTVIICLVLAKQDKDYALVVSLAVCSMVAAAAVVYLEPVISFFRQLQRLGNMEGETLQILLKSVGIGLLAEIVCMVCQDAGNGALGKAVQILSTAVILWLSLPLMESLLELIGKVLSEV